MHFLLLGTTGRTGQHVLATLLSQNHTATALVRDPSKLTPHPNLTITTGSPLSRSDVTTALSATTPNLIPSAAIITLNTLRASDSPFAAQISPPRFLADCVATTCAVLEEHGVHRVVVMSTAGVGDSWGSLPLVSRLFMRWTNVKYALEDHGIVDSEMRTREGMEWTLVRAVKLRFEGETGERKEVEMLGSTGGGMTVRDSVGVESVARFLVKVAVEGLFVREAVVVRDLC
ncbi:hypothetical protein OQA88_7896 [Cercophora sp. LCS_1]